MRSDDQAAVGADRGVGEVVGNNMNRCKNSPADQARDTPSEKPRDTLASNEIRLREFAIMRA